MEVQTCSHCERNQTAILCGLCQDHVCKSCARILSPESFALAPSAEFSHGAYCSPCYDGNVAAPLAEYFDTLETAKNIDVYFKNQTKETRLVSRKEKPVKIAGCPDRDEVVMRLAFHAATHGFDAVVDIDLKSEKIREGSYQKLIWRGTGIPTNAKGRVITTDKSVWHNPN